MPDFLVLLFFLSFVPSALVDGEKIYTVHFVCFVLVKAVLSHRDTEILNLA